MARGGMYDQLAGGFARYSVDARWVVPHFEKMLYDNALLLRVYAHLARVAGPAAALARRVAEETAAFLLRDLRTPEGGFASALDADTDGVEGLTYAWTPAQLVEVLGDDDGAWAARAARASPPAGTFEHGTLDAAAARRPRRPGALASACGPRCWPRATGARSPPATTRSSPPGTAWRSLALAEAGAALGRPDWVAAADATADLLLARHVVDGRLRRSSRDGVVGAAAGVLEDHALPRRGAARAAPGHRRRRAGSSRPCELLDLALAHFADPTAPGALLRHRRRRRGPAAPAAGDHRQRHAERGGRAGRARCSRRRVLVDDPAAVPRAAEAALRSAGTLAARFPRFAGHWLTVAEAAARGPLQVAVVGRRARPRRRWPRTPARSPRAARWSSPASRTPPGVPLLADRPLVDGAAGGLRLPRLRLRPPRHQRADDLAGAPSAR